MNTTAKKAHTKKRAPARKYLYLPELQRTLPGSAVIGYLCRTLSAWLAVWGLLLFINEALEYGVSAGYLALASLVPVVILALASSGWIGAIISVGMTAVSVFIFVLSVNKPLQLAYFSALSLYNGICARLGGLGYRSPDAIPFDFTPYFPTLTASDLTRAGLTLLGIFLAVIITLSIIKRVHLLPVATLTGVICVFIFTYNLCGRSWGFTLMLAAFCGMAVMRAYEHLNRAEDSPKPKDKFKGAALGGFAGLAAMVLAFIVLLLPTLTIDKKWIEIGGINSKMEIARQIVSSVIIGDVPDFSDLGFSGHMDTLASRTAAASPRTFTGAKVMEVRTNYNLPVYLRSFVSGNFEKDKWQAPKKSGGEAPVGEEIARGFYNLIDPKLTALNDYKNYVSRIEYGYVSTPVDVKLLSGNGNLLYIPSRYDPVVGLLKYGGEPGAIYGEEHENYADGIVTTSWLNFNKSYRALTYVQSFRHEDAFANLSQLDLYYRLCRRYIEMSRANPKLDCREEAANDIIALGLEKAVERSIYTSWYELSEKEREKFYKKLTVTDEYNQYAAENYLNVDNANAQLLTNITLNIFVNRNLASLTVYDKVMAVIDYLKDNYTYTLSPRQPSDDKLNPVQAFLLDTREGYCVQFATAAALMLRTLGVPTRYCEGFIASEFILDKAENLKGNEGRYTATVTDYNAHAWIEVYVNNIGWLTFETTPEYYSGMYEHYNLPGGSTAPDYKPPEYKPPEELPDEEAGTAKTIKADIIITAISMGFLLIGALGGAVYFIRDFAAESRTALYRREDFVGCALRHKLDDSERRAAATAVADYITCTLGVVGLRPKVGELPPEYGERCVRVLRGEENADGTANNQKRAAKKPYGSLGVANEFTGAAQSENIEPERIYTGELGEVFGFMQREEFGDGMSEMQLRKCAEFLVALSDDIYKNLNPLSKFWFRHIKYAI